MGYSIDKIRNVVLLGHGGNGKTTLAESMLYRTGAIDRMGKIADGNTTCDYDPEEIKRNISIQTAIAPVEYNGFKINLLDTPGYFDFAGEVQQAVRVADAGIIAVTAKSGVSVGTEKAWKALTLARLPKILYMSKLDEDNADFERSFAGLREALGPTVTPFIIPIMDGEKTVGLCNVIANKSYHMEGDKLVDGPVPEHMKARVAELYDIVVERVAETSEELMEKFFDGVAFTEEEMAEGIKNGILNNIITPVYCGSAYSGLGTEQLLKAITRYFPSPDKTHDEKAINVDGTLETVPYTPDGKPSVFVFKTAADQYGRFSFFKVISGTVTPDSALYNTRSEMVEKFGRVYTFKGKKNTEATEICCGDIGAVAKLIDTKTGDTLSAYKDALSFAGINFDEPCYSQAIAPKTKGNEEKMAMGLSKIIDEDPTIKLENNTETKQMVISGAGDIHLDVVCSKLKSKFGVEVELTDAKVPYREKIRKKVSVEGKHKKQSGGHGQYGHVKMDFEPNYDGDEIIFEEKIFGGSVPKNYHPAVEKGIREAAEHGILAGYPMVGLKATLTDGSYHDVDSNELSFKMAARLAYKAGIALANPAILEPIGSLKVTVPDANMGDIIGDLNKRRGRVLGMNPLDGGRQVIEAEVPMAEVSKYAIDLRSMTQGRGSFVLKFERYEEAPPNVQVKVIADAKYVDNDEE
ncbi:MAG: elongation factor G [Ruminococcaceae bacterium]|nr:elongation factor G [Oscillospiraceae bacterium]